MSSARRWGLLALLVLVRGVSLTVLSDDAFFRLVPRSLTVGGFLLQPSWLDIALPLVFVVALWDSRRWARPAPGAIGRAALDALWILAFPLLAGLSLYLYVQRWIVAPALDGPAALRWIQFVLAFAAMNLFMDDLPVANRWARRGLALILAGGFALTQDLVLGPDAALYRIVGVLSGVGTLLAAATWALRPRFRQDPARAVVTAAFVGGVSCFLVVAARSDELFPLFLPALALVAGAATIRSASWWPRGTALAGTVSVGLFCSLLLPRWMSPQLRQQVSESAFAPAHTEAVGPVTVSYDDPRVREVALRLARVLEAANGASRESFGVSPEVRHLTIGGIAPGGFFAEFPDRIVGNLPSEKVIRLWRDGAALNATSASVDDIDPVNAILHEYAHLYGVAPYMPWIMGSEEEGWATWAATRLSRRLWEKHGAALWDPPYDYARRARAIADSNLRGRAVLWSHPDEFGGFRLWNALGRRDGEEELFRKRWRLTRRDQQRFLLQTSDPAAARTMAEGFGAAEFASFGQAPPVRFADAVSRDEFLGFAEGLGLPRDQMAIRYDRRAALPLRPSVTVPASRRVLDGALALALLGGAFAIPIAAGGARRRPRW